ncbi:ImmA/IrrE family metallo-endopeptidase [Acidiferrobacter sp.]|uniref:ImmA/IrrE family metallo-endopeptidase n=1 Tax=Acidiferrobacter sp. TaxID=1872107 RepID=UPI00262C7A5F|nr:ImmA/IrrE family metallo-endopeptidase [Acidiferrobacter sp.]
MMMTPLKDSCGRPLGPFSVIRERQRSYPVDVGGLAHDFGISVIRKDWPDDLSGAIGKDDKGYFIVVNAKHSEERQRFTIAHEIAHYVLHRDRIGKDGIKDGLLYRSKLSDIDERAANRLAADILMPADMLGRAAADAGGLKNLDQVAANLKVSRTALSIRLGLPT